MTAAPQGNWSIGLFEVGDVGKCLCSFLLPHCALATARTNMDQSDVYFNFCAMRHPTIYRWLIRSAYGIPGDAFEDCLLSTFCCCCTINQMLQTTSTVGNNFKEAGYHSNKKQFSSEAHELKCGECCYAFCCCHCALGTTMENAMGMPFLMGCCCVNICEARNLVRYQYRVQGSDCFDDFLTPTAVVCCYVPVGYVITVLSCGLCFTCVMLPIIGYFLAITTKLLQESDHHKRLRGTDPVYYLAPVPGSLNQIPANTQKEIQVVYVNAPAPPPTQVVYVQVPTADNQYHAPAQPPVVHATPTSSAPPTAAVVADNTI